MPMQFGTWFTPLHPPEWVSKLEQTSDYVIEETGMSRKELERVLQFLHEKDIIK